MADGFTIDTSEVSAFVAELGRVESSVLPEVDKLVKRNAQALKDQMVDDAKESPYFRRVGESVTYDSAYRVGEVAYEVGPDKARRGAAGLAGAYLGWPNGGGATLPLDEPVQRQQGRMVWELDQFLGGLLG